MQPKKSSSMIYDFAVIGSGLTGLLAAKSLVDQNFKVAIIEATEVFGGNNRSIKNPAGVFDNGIRFIPNKASSAAAIEFLKNTLQENIAEVVEIPPVTYENGTLKSFVGFGEEPPAFYDEIIYFTEPTQWKLNSKVSDWVQNLIAQLSNNKNCDMFARSIVTKFIANTDKSIEKNLGKSHGRSAEKNESTVSAVMINGQKTLMANNFIFAGNVKDLALLLPTGTLNQKSLAKLGKNQYWTSVGLDILFQDKVTESQAVHVLNGTTSDDIGPCAGIFYPAQENVGQFSQWISFVEDLEAEEEENIGAVLKKIKRQIKRAYPDHGDKILFERIMIVKTFGGNGELKLKDNGTIGNLNNLWVASSNVNSEKNILGAVLQAKFIVENIKLQTQDQDQNPVDVDLKNDLHSNSDSESDLNNSLDL